jgi:hypothetical protein
VTIDETSRAPLQDAGTSVFDPGKDGEWLRARGLTWALLRPDRYVFACGGLDDVGSALQAWRRIAPPARVEVVG